MRKAVILAEGRPPSPHVPEYPFVKKEAAQLGGPLRLLPRLITEHLAAESARSTAVAAAASVPSSIFAAAQLSGKNYMMMETFIYNP